MTRTTKEQRDAIRDRLMKSGHTVKRMEHLVALKASTWPTAEQLSEIEQAIHDGLALLDEIEGAEKGEAGPVAWRYRSGLRTGPWLSTFDANLARHEQEQGNEVQSLYAAPVTAKVTEEMVEEREKCARVADDFAAQFPAYPEFDDLHTAAREIAAAIRTGGKGQ